jgi:hypothetical protein
MRVLATIEEPRVIRGDPSPLRTLERGGGGKPAPSPTHVADLLASAFPDRLAVPVRNSIDVGLD